MTTSLNKLQFFAVAALLLLAAPRPALAGSATWNENPTSNDWTTGANWMPNTVPDSTADIATFSSSNVTNPTVGFGLVINLDSAVFNPGAPAYTITLDVSNLILNGAGIVNNSGLIQSMVIPEQGNLAGGLFFYEQRQRRKDDKLYSAVGGYLSISMTSSSAGSATFDLTSGSLQTSMAFSDSSHSRRCDHQRQRRLCDIEFLDSTTGGNATVNLSSAALVDVPGSFNAEHIAINCIGGNQSLGSAVYLSRVVHCWGRHLHERGRKHTG